MKNKDELNFYSDIDQFIHQRGDCDILNAWNKLTDSRLLSIKEAVNNQVRNQALKDAANILPSSLKNHTRAKFLLAHIEDFQLLKYPHVNENTELSPLEKCLLKAIKTGSSIPKSDTGIYNILTDNY